MTEHKFNANVLDESGIIKVVTYDFKIDDQFMLESREGQKIFVTVKDLERVIELIKRIEGKPIGWNYTANDETYPTEFTFDNGRTVRAVKTDDGQAILQLVTTQE